MSMRESRRELRLTLLAEQPTCSYCGVLLRRKTATLDHLRPKALGGSEDASNLVLCCSSCNQAKRDRDPIIWCSDILAAAARQGVLR